MHVKTAYAVDDDTVNTMSVVVFQQSHDHDDICVFVYYELSNMVAREVWALSQ